MTIQRRDLLASGAAVAVLGGMPRARAQGGAGTAPLPGTQLGVWSRDEVVRVDLED